MPANFIGEVILRAIFEFVFEIVAYYVGRMVVPIISCGRWTCDPLLRRAPKKSRRWSGFYSLRGQRIHLTSDATTLVGALFSLLVIIAFLWWRFGW